MGRPTKPFWRPGSGGEIGRDAPRTALNDRARALIGAWVKARPKYGGPRRDCPLRLVARNQDLDPHRGAALPVSAGAHAAREEDHPPHFRHTFATLELLARTDLATLAELLGHNINTTTLYLHLIELWRREAVRKLTRAIPAEILPPAESASSAPSHLPNPPFPNLGNPRHLTDRSTLMTHTGWSPLRADQMAHRTQNQKQTGHDCPELRRLSAHEDLPSLKSRRYRMRLVHSVLIQILHRSLVQDAGPVQTVANPHHASNHQARGSYLRSRPKGQDSTAVRLGPLIATVRREPTSSLVPRVMHPHSKRIAIPPE